MLEQPAGVGLARARRRSRFVLEHELLDELLLTQAVGQVNAVAQRHDRANHLACDPERRDDGRVHGRREGRNRTHRVVRPGVLDPEGEVLRERLPRPAAPKWLCRLGENAELLEALGIPVCDRRHVKRALLEIGDADDAAVADEICEALRDPLSGARAGLPHPSLSSPCVVDQAFLTPSVFPIKCCLAHGFRPHQAHRSFGARSVFCSA